MASGLIWIVAALQATATLGPLPQGKWTLEYADNMCVASRWFGTPGNVVMLALRPLPLGNSVELVLIEPGKAIHPHPGKATVTIGPDGKPQAGRYLIWADRAGRDRFTMVTFDDTEHALATAATIAIATDKKPPVRVVPAGIGQVMAAMKPCQEDLLRSWKIDPKFGDLIVTPAVAIDGVEAFFSSDDYPAEAMRAEFSGTSTILWTIGTDGKVSACRTVGRSGSEALDKAACAAIIRRGRYTPALDKDGKPVASYLMRRINWRAE